MARKTTGMLGKGEIIEINGLTLKRLQGGALGVNLSNEDMKQMGDGGVIERKSNLPDTSLKLDFNAIGYVGNFMLMAGYKNSGWMPQLNSGLCFTMTSAGMDINGDATLGFDTNNMPEIVARYSEFNDTVLSRSAYVPGMFVNSYELRAATDGVATESFSLAGDSKTDYDGASKDIRVVVCYPIAATSSATWDPGYADFSSGYTFVKAFVNRIDSYTTEVTPSFATNSLAIAGVTFDGTERVVMLLTKDTSQAFPGLADTNERGGLRRGAIVISLHKATEAETKSLRIQSVAATLNLGRIASNEMGTQRDVDRVVTYPVPVKADITINDNDLEMMKQMVGTSSTVVDANNYVNDMVVTMSFYNSETVHLAANLLCKVTMSGMKVASENSDGKAGASFGTRTFSLEGNNFIMSGTGVNPFVL